MAAEGVKPVQATVLTQEVFPAAKQVVGKKKATKKQTEALLGSISHALTIEG
jgi:hypothetical protein